jgi:hypothetical protein
VVIEHPVEGLRPLADVINPRSAETVGRELARGGGEDPLARRLGVAALRTAAPGLPSASLVAFIGVR